MVTTLNIYMNNIDNNFFLKRKKTISQTTKQDFVHLYLVNLKELKGKINDFSKILSGEEQDYTKEYLVEKAKTNFILSQGILRFLLSFYLEINPRNIFIRRDKHGKPYIYGKAGKNFFFNKSHSGDFAFYGFTDVSPIGVDIEIHRTLENFEAISEKVMTERELLEMNKFSQKEKNDFFFKYWSCKESYSKAIGLGLYKDFKNIELYISPKKNLVKVLSIDQQKLKNATTIRILSPIKNYAFAYCLLGKSKNISFTLLNQGY